MPGLFDALGTASQGLRAVQQGVSTTAHNIANVNTPGYTRQRQVLQATRPVETESGALGTGVEQVSIERITDQFIQLRLISETSRLSSLDTLLNTHRTIESIVNDQQAGGLNDALAEFFGSLDDLASSADPGQPAARDQLLAAAQTLVDTLHLYDRQLRELGTGADRAIIGTLPEINSLSKNIAELNVEIMNTEALAPANDLRDRRDQLILELAEKVDIKTRESDRGSISIVLGAGLPLVEGDRAAELVAVVDPSSPNALDPTFSQVFFQGTSSFFDVSASLRGGEIGGHLEARDQVITAAVRDLDAFAFSLAESVNLVHRGGLGLVDGASRDFFSDLSAQASVDDSARNIAVAADILADVRHIAAGNQPAGGVGPEAGLSDTGNVEALKDLRNLGQLRYLAGDIPGTPTGSSSSLTNQLISLVGLIGQDVRATERAFEQQGVALAGLQDRRDSVSGVSIDEEVTSLIQLQASFQANARVISTVNQLFDDLLAAF